MGEQPHCDYHWSSQRCIYFMNEDRGRQYHRARGEPSQSGFRVMSLGPDQNATQCEIAKGLFSDQQVDIIGHEQ